jgi:enoyl-CoA hydratase/carnithine racemase
MADDVTLPPLRVDLDGPVARIFLTRPDSLNLLGLEGDGEVFREACRAINLNREIRCAVITGEGRAFSAGGDLNEMKAKRGAFSGSGIDIRNAYRRNVHGIVRAIYDLEVPLIAAVNGPAVGLGCDITCMADLRIASDKARFGVSFLKIGLIPGDGGSWILPRVIGMSRAAEMLFTAEVIDAQKAEAWGMVSRIVPADDLMAEASALAERIAALPGHASRLTKSLLRQSQSIGLETALELSASNQALSHLTDDHLEGVSALLERRDPDFRGR